MKKLSLICALALGSFFLISCQTVPYQGQAREVKRKPSEGGIIALAVNHRPEDRAQADVRMKSNCAQSEIKILEEGEVAVGQTTTSNASETNRASTERKAGMLFGIPVMTGQASGTDTSTSSTTTQIKEWQISYECVAARKRKSL